MPKTAPAAFDLHKFIEEFLNDPVHKGVLEDLAAYDAAQRKR